MFKWFQDRINKKRSPPGNHPLEIATEVFCDDTISPQSESGYEERSSPPDLARTHLPGPKQDLVGRSSLELPKKRQGDEAASTLDVKYPRQCPAEDLLRSSHGTHSSSSTKGEGTPLETHTDCLQQYLTGFIHTKHYKEGTQSLENHMQRSSILQTDIRSPPSQDTYSSHSNPQELRGNIASPLDGLKNTTVGILNYEENISNSQPHKGGSSSPPGYRKTCSNPQKHQKGTLRPSSIQEDKNDTCSLQHFSRSHLLKIAESAGTLEKHAECMTSTLDHSSSNSQEHKDSITNAQDHIADISSQLEHRERTIRPQEHKESSQHIVALTEGTLSSQGDTGYTSRPQEHTKNFPSSQEQIQSTSSTQKPRENTSSTQGLRQSVRKPSEQDTCQYSSSPLDLTGNTDVTSAVGGNKCSDPSLPSTISLVSARPQPHPTIFSKNDIVGHESQNYWKDRKENQEQEIKCFRKTESNFIPKENLSQMSDQSVDEADFSCLQERNTPEEVNRYSSKSRFSSEVENESEAHEANMEASAQVGGPLPCVDSEKELIRGGDTVLNKDNGKIEAAVVKVDRYTQTKTAKESFSNECPSLCCLHQACLYNQKGRKCTVLDEHYILTYLKDSPLLVRTTIEDSGTGPMGCMVAWVSGKAIEFRELQDGTEVYFDAVVSPKTSSFVTLVIWLDTKPAQSTEPYYSCYVIVELVRNCPIKFVSFAKENGLVSAHISGQTVNVVFSKSVVYVNGEKVKNAKEIKNLSQPTLKQLYGDVLKLMTLDPAGKVVYGFTSSCIWQGCKPLHPDPPIVYDPLKLYKSTVGYFAPASKQSLLLCDRNALLETRGTSYKIFFENEGQLIELVCDNRKIFSGNHRSHHPADGKVKVHLRKQSAKGVCTWIVLMVQVQSPPLPQPPETAASSTQLQHNKEAAAHPSPLQVPSSPVSDISLVASTQSSLRSVASPDETELHQVANNIDERDAVLSPQYTAPREASDSGFDRNCGNEACEKIGKVAVSCDDTATVTEEKSDEEHLKGLAQRLCPPKASCGSTVGKVTHVPGVWVKENAESFVQGGQSSYSHNVSCQDDQYAPIKIIQNGRGVLKNTGETFFLEASVVGEVMHIEMGKTPWVAFDSGEGKRCKSPMPDMSVGFDAHFVDFPSAGPVGHILALWSGKKPLKASLEGTTYFYDAPAVYHGTDEEGWFKFMVMLEGNLTFITTTSTSAIFEANGEHCASVATLSHVFLHLSMSQGSWTLLLMVLQPKHKPTHLIREESSGACLKSSSLPDLNAEKNCKLKTKTADTHKTCQVPVVELTHYVRNLHGTLAENSGERVIITQYKNIPLSVEIPKNCNVDLNTLGQNIQDIPIGTKLRCDAFCENLKSLRYWAVVVWLEKKPQKSVSYLDSIFYYNVSGRCLSSSEEEIGVEIFLEGKSRHLVSRGGYVIMPDGTYQASRDLKVGTPIQVNLLQQNEGLSINQFIYITACAPQGTQPSLLPERWPEEGNKPANGAKKETNKMKPGVAELLNASQENLKSAEVKSRVAKPPPVSLQMNLKRTEVESGAAESHTNSLMEILKSVEVRPKVAEPSITGSKENFKSGEGKSGSSSLAFLTTDKNKVAANTSNPITSEYIIVKGIVSQPHQNTFSFSDDTGSLTVNINPVKIAVDLPSDPILLTGEFYLVYHRHTHVGVCGWYRNVAREVYLQLNMRVYAHNTDNKILTLGLPDKTSLYNFTFDNEVLVKGNKVQRQEELKSGLIVHPIIEDIKPCLIDGCVVSHRIAFITTVKGVAATCVNFLKHSLLDNEEKQVPSIDQLLCHAVSVNHPLPRNSNILSFGDGSGRVHGQNEGGTCTSSINVATDTLLKQWLFAKGNNDAENSFSVCVDFPNVSEDHSYSEISTHSQGIQFLEKNLTGNVHSVDGEGDALQELICSRYPRALSKTLSIQYVILCGEVRTGSSGTHVFASSSLSSPIGLPANLPHLDVSIFGNRRKCLMLARKMCPKEAGAIDYQPVVMWPEGKQCDPYIVVSYKVLRKRGFLQVTDAADGSEKWYLYDYDSVLSLKSTYKISEVKELFIKQGKTLVLYALVENIPPLQIQGHYVQGNILLLTTSKRIAVASVDIFIGSYYDDTMFQASDGPIGQLLHLHKVRMDRAVRCKRGTTCYYPWRESSFVPSTMSVGGCLEAHTDDFAILRCNKRTTTAVCHLSNIYYQGLKITSWGAIPKHLRKNFWAIILPLDEIVKEGKWEVDAVALVAWCCRGPQVLATHQCYYHVLTLYVPHIEPEESQQASQTSESHSEENFHPVPFQTFPKVVMSLTQLESWQCPAGSTIFAFHKSILQCSGLRKINGKVTLVNEMMILYTSTENEVIKCKISNVFIRGKQCQSVREVTSEIDQTYNILARTCPPTTYSGKTVKMEGVIAFIGSLKSTGIHICNKHACILESSFPSEEIAIAEEVFHDIAILCEQSSQCSDYYLSMITIPEGETQSPLRNTLKTMNLKFPTLCHGVVVGLDKESDDQARIKVTLQQGPDVFTLPVCRSRLMGLHRDLPLQHTVGHPLKVMLGPMGADYWGKSRILVAWGSFSQKFHVSPNFMDEPAGHNTQRSKFFCCPKALLVKEFQSLFNTDMFELKSLYKFRNVDEESGIGFFHYWLDERLITCKVEYIVGWPKVSSAKEELWNLLVPKVARAEKESPEAVAAWQSDTDSLAVGLCDIHGVNGLNVSYRGKGNIKSKSPLFSVASRGRRNSEPRNIGLPVDHKLIHSSRTRYISGSSNFSPPADSSGRPSSIVEEDDPTLSKSLPTRMGLAFAHEYDVRNSEHNQDLQHSSGSTTLLSIDEGSATGEGGESIKEDISQCGLAHLLCTSSVSGENYQNSANIENKNDRIFRCTLTTIKSSSFICIENHCGLLIDSISHITALVSQGKLYINKVKPKESFKEIFSTCSQEGVNAIVVPLGTPVTIGDLRVTHEAVVAWLGSRPAGIGSMVKNTSMATPQAETLLHDKTDMKTDLLEHEGDIRDSVMPSKIMEVIKPHKGSMWAARPTLRVIYAKQEIVLGCSVEGYADHCGILQSTKGPILFDRQVVNVGQQAEAMPGAPQAGQEELKLEALVLELEQPIKVLGCEVKRIAVVVWSKDKPVLDDSLIATNLEVYKMNWIVVIIHNLSAVNKRHNLKKSTCRSFCEITSFSGHGRSHCSEFVYYCSQEYTVRQHEVILVLFEHVLLKHQDSLVLALKDDVKCSMSSVAEGKHLQVIAVRVVEPFNFCSHLITHFALLVYAEEMKPPEAAAVLLDWSRGKIEKVTSVVGKLDDGLVKANIHIKIDRPAGARPFSLGSLWPLTQDRPEGDMIFAAEGEVYKLMSDCGIMKITGITLNDREIKMFFLKDTVLINDKHLPVDDPMDLQLVPVLKQAWHCTGQRLCSYERQSVTMRTGEEAQYKAFLVWCEVCPLVQSVKDCEGNTNETKMALSTVLTSEALLQSAAANVTTLPVSEQLMGGQVETAGRRIGSFCAVNSPTVTDFHPKMKHSSETTEDPGNGSNQQVKSTSMGRVTEVHQIVAQLALENEHLQYVARDRCFVYGVCLANVELWHVLSIGLAIEYELTEDGNELKGVWVGGTDSLDPPLLLHTLRQWCYDNNVTPSATNVLLMEAGWLPSDLTPTVAPEEDMEVVEVVAPHSSLLRP